MNKTQSESNLLQSLQTRLVYDSSKSGALLSINNATTKDGLKIFDSQLPTVPQNMKVIKTEYFKADDESRKSRLNALFNHDGEEIDVTDYTMRQLIPRFGFKLPPLKTSKSCDHFNDHNVQSSVPETAPTPGTTRLLSNQKRLISPTLRPISSRSSTRVSGMEPRQSSSTKTRVTSASRLNSASSSKIPCKMKSISSVESIWGDLSEENVAEITKKNFFKKVEFDDTPPENSDFFYNLRNLRQRLLWPCDFPQYELGTRDRIIPIFLKEAKISGLMPVDVHYDPDQWADYLDAEDKKGTKVMTKSETVQNVILTKTDDGMYVYCLPRNRLYPGAGYNPYDLEVASANEAKLSLQYWAMSASAMTLFWREEGRSEECFTITPIYQWLWEKELYDGIKDLRVFKSFRLWKFFNIWVNNVRSNKCHTCHQFLQKRLYVANEVLQGCLLHVQGLCQAALPSVSFVLNKLADNYFHNSTRINYASTNSPITFLDLSLKESLPLDQFLQQQKQHTQHGLDSLKRLRENVVDIVYEACVIVAEMEGIRSGIRADNEERKSRLLAETPAEAAVPLESATRKNTGPQSVHQVKVAPPSYAEIAQWKKILRRIFQFLRLIDCHLEHLCHEIVVISLEALDSAMQISWDSGIKVEEEVKNSPADLQRRNSQENDHWLHNRSFQKVKPESEKLTVQPYVIPKFDFDAPEKKKMIVDPDELIRRIKSKDLVIEVPKALFTVQLVLNVPEQLPIKKSQRTSAAKSSSHKQSVGEPSELDGGVADMATNPMIKEEDGEDEEEEEEDEESETSDNDNNDNFMSDEDDEQGFGPGSLSNPGEAGRSYLTLHFNQEEFVEGLMELFHYMEQAVGNLPSLLKEDKLQIFDPSKYDRKSDVILEDEDDADQEDIKNMVWPNLLLLFGRDPYYQNLIQQVRTRIQEGFDVVSNVSRNYRKVCAMVDKARIQENRISAGNQQWNTEDFHQLLFHFTDQLIAIDSMTKITRLNMFQLEAEGFSVTSRPYPAEITSEVHQRLPKVANKKNDDLLQIIRSGAKRLDHTPETVEEFVEHLSFLNKMTNDLPAVEKEFVVINQIFSISKDFDVPMEPECLALYKTLGPSFQHLKNTLTYHEAKKEENLHKFSVDLDRLIIEIRKRIIDIKVLVLDPNFLSADAISPNILEQIINLQEEVGSLNTRIRSYANYQERFGSSIESSSRNKIIDDLRSSDSISAASIQSELAELERDLSLRRLLWESQDEWSKLYEEWTASPFDEINVEQLQKSVNKFTQTIYMLEKGLPNNEILPLLKSKVSSFKQCMPVIVAMRNPAIQPRHWELIETLIQRTLDRDSGFTLGELLNLNLMKFKDKIQDISATASNEATLETMLQKVISQWQTTEFRLVSHSTRETSIIAATDDVVTQLEESQIVIAMIKGSRYVAPIKTQVEEWERRLALFNRTLEEWMSVQRLWLYLEQIFATPDIQRQLLSENKVFTEVNKHWIQLMRNVEDKPNALKAGTAQGVLQTLQFCNMSLEKIQKSLEDYLETKRLIFPRFYFLGNDELLEILAKSKDPNSVQPHLDKLFGNIKSLEIFQPPKQPPTVLSMTSSEGEVMPMPKNVRARGALEQWLGSVEQGMNDTVKKHLKQGMADFMTISIQAWVLKHHGQVILTASQIFFNRDVLEALNSESSVKDSMDHLLSKMLSVLKSLANLVSHSLESHRRLAIEAMLMSNVHNRDIVASLIQHHVSTVQDFQWKRQLRYEWEEVSNNCQVFQDNASFLYGYEYLGCSPRLVLTPLTDRCYLTLTGALHLNLGGSPAGPAGTGKTETVKDLAKSLGKQCVVFNCSEGLDYKMMGKLFSGLVQSGSWCCFDEFNRIDIEVLSVVASQIHTIKSAKDGNLHRFQFEGRDIKLNATCGIFITMNPTYAGRVELPDNLKSLFRPMAMMVPDYALIAEILLFSEGFVFAKNLSCKIVNLYQLASKQLSQQDHYDFGMRAIKSVLVMAGHMRVVYQKSGHLSDENEEARILIQALRESNMPRFVAEDVSIFESIMSDLFPGLDIPDRDNPVMEKAIDLSISEHNLQKWPRQIDKVHQLHNQMMVRHGVMLVGPTGGGKTTVRNILQKSLSLLPTLSLTTTVDDSSGAITRQVTVNRNKKAIIDCITLNPKCVSMGELYGEADPNTLEWKDGLIAVVTRKFSKLTRNTLHTPGPPSQHPMVHLEARRPSLIRKQSVDLPRDFKLPAEQEEPGHQMEIKNWQWIVLDGPVDTIWVENLNTVLDDSKILCLANAERIGITSTMRYVFEVDHLSNASPATVSRCAMVYMDPVELGWKPFVGSWLANKLPRNFPPGSRQHLESLLYHSIDRGLSFTRHYRKYQLIAAPELGLVQSLCALLSAYLNFMSIYGGFGEEEIAEAEDEKFNRKQSQAVNLEEGGRPQFDTQKSSKPQEAATNLLTLFQRRPDGRLYHLQKNPKDINAFLGKLFVFAFTWSFGACFNRVDDPDQERISTASYVIPGKSETAAPITSRQIDVAEEFDLLVHELFDIEPPLGVRLPSSSRSIYSYFVDLESGSFLPWEVLVPSTQSLIERGVISVGESGASGNTASSGSAGNNSKQLMLQKELITTTDSLRCSFIMALHLMNGSPVLIAGEPGVGKSSIIKETLKRLQESGGSSYKTGTILGSILNYSDRNQALLDSIQNLTRTDVDTIEPVEKQSKSVKVVSVITSHLEFSAQTSAARLQTQITGKMIKRGRDAIGAPRGKKLITFIDDINMPSPDLFGTQPPIELLRQMLDMNGYYEPNRLQWRMILDHCLVSACAPVGGGRNVISPRLIKHFCILTLPQPSTQSLQHIYQVQLGRYLQDNDFSADVRAQLPAFVSSAIAIYYKMKATMKPTPAKIHYTFNLRDLSKVIHGLFQAHEKVIVQRDHCAQLLAHEATRIFHDRLCTIEDRDVFHLILADELHNYFKVRWSAEQLQRESVVFANFFDNPSATEKIYRPLTDRVRLAQIMEDIYMKKNVDEKSTSQHVFFREAVDHITRIVRVLNQPCGHLLLVGLDGTGKTTAVQLACLIAKTEVFRLTLTPGYSISDFRNDLKKVYEKAGLAGKNIAFLLTDSDLVKEHFLEDINSVLNSGDVSDLFDYEEVDGILMNLKRDAGAAGISDNREDTYNFFIERVNRNLHVILTMSPAGANFRHRCRATPALVNCSTIDWFDEWDPSAMLSVAQVYFRDEDFLAEDQELGQRVSEVCVQVHHCSKAMATRFWEEMRRSFYLTPSSFIEFIKTFSHMLHDNRGAVLRNRDRLRNGLDQLETANSLVGTMKEELVELGPQIEEKAKETDELLARLERDRVLVEEIRQMVLSEESLMQQETQVVEEYARQCEEDLDSVAPALQKATEALDALNKTDISEVRVYQNPPEAVTILLSTVCILLGEKTDWKTAKVTMGDPNFLKRLVEFDKTSMTEKIMRKIRKFTVDPNFNPEYMSKVSNACMCICTWVLALQHYYNVHKMVKPKQKRVDDAREALTLAHANLARKQERLARIQAHLDNLQQQYQNSVDEREALKERKSLTGLRLTRAGLLIKALQSEKSRWEEGTAKLDDILEGILGDTLLSAACVAYQGILTARYRHLLLQEWITLCDSNQIPRSDQFDFVTSQFPANVLLQWHNQSLPRDPHSTENAVILKKSRRWCLFIDPQHQGVKFLQGMHGSHLQLLSVNDPSYIQSLERCIRVGDPVVLQDLQESLDPTLGPVLRQETYQSSGNTMIKMGENEIEYNENFRLYLKTSYSNPQYLPSVSILVTIINFTVNFDGLEEQLLSSVVSKEKPELETARATLLANLAADMSLLRELEDRTLGLLQQSTGHILDDEALPATLEKSKSMVQEIGTRVHETEETEKQLSIARKVYLPVATRGATLYFVLSDLSHINLMYQYSLTWFQDMFETCIAQIPPGDDLDRRMADMIQKITRHTYQVASAALFSHHQLIFSFLLCTSVMRSRNSPQSNSEVAGEVPMSPQSSPHPSQTDKNLDALDPTRWSLFLHGPVLAGLMMEKDANAIQGESTSHPDWIFPEIWQQCLHLEHCLAEQFTGLTKSLRENEAQWQTLKDSNDPYLLMKSSWIGSEETFHWEELSSFEKAILIKILYPAKLQTALRHLVMEQLGSEFLYAGQSSLLDIYEQSEASTPIIFILAPGADPSQSLVKLSKEVRGSTSHLDMVSLGRGQGVKAEELISKAPILKGRWIFLQNCDLAASWMPKLQQLVDNFHTTTQMDEDFRLFLSAKPNSDFPISVLHAGIKMAVESPRGIKNILLRTFAVDGTGLLSPNKYNEVSDKQRGLIFSLCLFNAVILERKKYGPLGFNLIYEFNDSDLEVALLQMDNLCASDQISWEAVHHLIGDITYGGRVTDDWDRRCLNSLLAKYQNEKVLISDHCFTEDDDYPLRVLPANHTFEMAREYLENLPELDSASAFGMGYNAELASMQSQSKTFMDVVISVQPRITSADLARASGGSDSSQPHSEDMFVQDVVKEMIDRLPKRVEDVSEEDQDTRKRLGAKPALSKSMHLDIERVEKALERNEKFPDAVKEPIVPFFRSALHNVLRQEIDRYDILLHLINKTLRHLTAGIVGDEVMTEELDQAYSSLLMNKVPNRWAKYASCKTLSDWTTDLIERVHFLAVWAERLVRKHQEFLSEVEINIKSGGIPGGKLIAAPNPELLLLDKMNSNSETANQEEMENEGYETTSSRDATPTVDGKETQESDWAFIPDQVMKTQVEPTAYWLPGFFFPQGFITGVLQNQARKIGVSVDSLSLQFDVKNQYFSNQTELLDTATPFDVRRMSFQNIDPPKEGVLIFGLYIDNACWNLQQALLSRSPHGRRFCKLPELHFRAVVMDAPTADIHSTVTTNTADKHFYTCPLYRTSLRVGSLSSTGHSTNFVTSINLPTDHPPEFWTLRGTALLTQPDI